VRAGSGGWGGRVKENPVPSLIALSRSFLGSTGAGRFELFGFLSCPSTMLLSGLSFGGLFTIILAISPFVMGIWGARGGPLEIGGGGGGGGGGGMLHGGETGRGGAGSGVGGGGGKSWGTDSVSSTPIGTICPR
jgi:hypothetical protein